MKKSIVKVKGHSMFELFKNIGKIHNAWLVYEINKTTDGFETRVAIK